MVGDEGRSCFAGGLITLLVGDTMRYQGRITEWRDEHGYGFVTPNGGGERSFLHIKAFKPGSRRPTGNELVNYVLTKDERGRLKAEQVEYVVLRKQPAPTEPNKPSLLRMLFASLFLAAIGALVATGKIPAALLFAYLGLSVFTFLSYALDKSAAREGRWRTPESTLQVLALLGGWPGAIFAQQVLRHKSRKESFQIVFWFVICVNLAVFVWLLSAPGSHFLTSALGG